MKMSERAFKRLEAWIEQVLSDTDEITKLIKQHYGKDAFSRLPIGWKVPAGPENLEGKGLRGPPGLPAPGENDELRQDLICANNILDLRDKVRVVHYRLWRAVDLIKTILGPEEHE